MMDGDDRLRALAPYVPAAWAGVRFVVGVEWLRASWHKLGDAGWTEAPRGAAIEGYLRGAIAQADEDVAFPAVQGWWSTLAEEVFLPNSELLAFIVAYGQLLVGIALIVGLLTRVTAAFGLSMNLAFSFSGSVATNPPMILLQLAIILFGARAGTIGFDRWVVPEVRRIAGDRLNQVWDVGVVVLGVAALAFLARIATNTGGWETSLIAIAIAAVVAAATWWTRSRPAASA